VLGGALSELLDHVGHEAQADCLGSLLFASLLLAFLVGLSGSDGLALTGQGNIFLDHFELAKGKFDDLGKVSLRGLVTALEEHLPQDFAVRERAKLVKEASGEFRA
jgi:hypothetical protein